MQVLLAFRLESLPSGFALEKGRAPARSQETGCTAGTEAMCQCTCVARNQELAQPGRWHRCCSASTVSIEFCLPCPLASPHSVSSLHLWAQGHRVDSLALLRFLNPFILGVHVHWRPCVCSGGMSSWGELSPAAAPSGCQPSPCSSLPI